MGRLAKCNDADTSHARKRRRTASAVATYCLRPGAGSEPRPLDYVWAGARADAAYDLGTNAADVHLSTVQRRQFRSVTQTWWLGPTVPIHWDTVPERTAVSWSIATSYSIGG